MIINLQLKDFSFWQTFANPHKLIYRLQYGTHSIQYRVTGQNRP